MLIDARVRRCLLFASERFLSLSLPLSLSCHVLSDTSLQRATLAEMGNHPGGGRDETHGIGTPRVVKRHARRE